MFNDESIQNVLLYLIFMVVLSSGESTYYFQRVLYPSLISKAVVKNRRIVANFSRFCYNSMS